MAEMSAGATTNDPRLLGRFGQVVTILDLKEAGLKVQARSVNPKFNTLTAGSIFVSCPESEGRNGTVLFLVEERLLKQSEVLSDMLSIPAMNGAFREIPFCDREIEDDRTVEITLRLAGGWRLASARFDWPSIESFCKVLRFTNKYGFNQQHAYVWSCLQLRSHRSHNFGELFLAAAAFSEHELVSTIVETMLKPENKAQCLSLLDITTCDPAGLASTLSYRWALGQTLRPRCLAYDASEPHTCGKVTRGGPCLEASVLRFTAHLRDFDRRSTPGPELQTQARKRRRAGTS